MKAHYDDPIWGTFGFSIIVHTLQVFQNYGTFNFGYEFWFLGRTNIIYTKPMLCNITF